MAAPRPALLRSLVAVAGGLLFTLGAGASRSLHAQDTVSVAQEDAGRPRFRGFRFAELVDPNADLRGIDSRQVAAAAAAAVASVEGIEDPTPDQLMGATLEVFRRFGFAAVEQAAKSGAISPEASRIIADGRQELISAALKGTLARVDPEGTIQIGALDSGNKASGIASDIDQTLFVMPVEVGRETTVTELDVIEAFTEVFTEITGGLPPEHFEIESMDGRDFPPDLRQRHQTLSDVAAEMRAVFLSKSENAALYRTEGELSIQAIGRGERAIREYFEELERRDRALTEEKRAVDSDPSITDRDAAHRRLEAAHLRWMKQNTPFRTVAWGVDENGDRAAVEHFDRDPRIHGVMEFPPEILRRFSFDGSFDNWLMYESHPENRPKYLIRSVADGIGLLSRLQTVDSDAPWRTAPFDYNEVFRQDEELAKYLIEIDNLKKILEKRATVILDADERPFYLLKDTDTPSVDGGREQAPSVAADGTATDVAATSPLPEMIETK